MQTLFRMDAEMFHACHLRPGGTSWNVLGHCLGAVIRRAQPARGSRGRE